MIAFIYDSEHLFIESNIIKLININQLQDVILKFIDACRNVEHRFDDMYAELKKWSSLNGLNATTIKK